MFIKLKNDLSLHGSSLFTANSAALIKDWKAKSLKL